jgi:hypothetical protein
MDNSAVTHVSLPQELQDPSPNQISTLLNFTAKATAMVCSGLEKNSMAGWRRIQQTCHSGFSENGCWKERPPANNFCPRSRSRRREAECDRPNTMHSRQLLKTRQVMYYVTSLCGLSSWGFSSRCPCFQGKKKITDSAILGPGPDEVRARNGHAIVSKTGFYIRCPKCVQH